MRIVLVFAVLFSVTFTSAQEPVRQVRRSPDGLYFAGWFDHDAGAPFGSVRAVVFRSATDSYDIFSFVSTPRYTEAAWNPASTRCVIADAPDNAGPTTWLIYQRGPGKWDSRKLDPFATVYAAFAKSDARHLFRPSILKIEWLSDVKVRFRGYCNTGTYLFTIDTALPDNPPETTKLSAAWLDE
ncbi:MAG: hypothetical protein JWL90_1410 [Chthoniobacteraceae bacterium]|nr:hypothetical protein [Chthoniobacteraceae bacterium]